MENEQSPRRIIYRPAESGSLGPEWEVIQVILQCEEGGLTRTSASVVLARHANGNIIRKTGILPDRWEQIIDEDALRACQELFGNRDRLAVQNSDHSDDPEVRIGTAEGAERDS